MPKHTQHNARALVAISLQRGVFLSWRLLPGEILHARRDGLVLSTYLVYKNGACIARVAGSTHYTDPGGTAADAYAVAPVGFPPCSSVRPWAKGFYELPLQRPQGGRTPAGVPYQYAAERVAVGDVDGDGEYEYIVLFAPRSERDGAPCAGPCLIDCYTLCVALRWRLNLGPNIRAGEDSVPFVVMDFDGDGQDELVVKTAPGSVMTRFEGDGGVRCASPVTLPEADRSAGVTHADNYARPPAGFRQHIADTLRFWNRRPEVKAGLWPATAEACFGEKKRFLYPLTEKTALEMADDFLNVYAPGRDPRNALGEMEGFVCDGPEYLTRFAGDGRELETIPFPFPRGEGGLLWGEYADSRIEPGSRMNRFLFGAAFLDGKRPSLIVSRGGGTRLCIAAYDVTEGRLAPRFAIDSGFLPMQNPFRRTAQDAKTGTDPVYGALARTACTALAFADVDGDGRMEILAGASLIGPDGALRRTQSEPPAGWEAPIAAALEPDAPGPSILCTLAPQEDGAPSLLLLDGKTGNLCRAIPQPSPQESACARTVAGCFLPHMRGGQFSGCGLYTACGEPLPLYPPEGGARILFSGDLTAQTVCTDNGCRVTDYLRGALLSDPGVPLLIADLLGDHREELLLRTPDSTALRIYACTEEADRPLPPLMQDAQYRCAVARQAGAAGAYPSYYIGPDMDFRKLP